LVVWKVVIERVTVIKFRMDNGGGNGAGFFEVEIWGQERGGGEWRVPKMGTKILTVFGLSVCIFTYLARVEKSTFYYPRIL